MLPRPEELFGYKADLNRCRNSLKNILYESRDGYGGYCLPEGRTNDLRNIAETLEQELQEAGWYTKLYYDGSPAFRRFVLKFAKTKLEGYT